jgi:hypothetical protein
MYRLSCAAWGLCILSVVLSAEQAKRFRDEYESLPEFEKWVKAVDRGERFSSLDLATHISRGTGGTEVPGVPAIAHHAFDPNVLLREFNAAYDQLVAAMSIEDYPTRSREVAEVLTQLDEQATQDLMTSVPVALMLIGDRSAMTRRMGRVLSVPAVHVSQTNMRREEQALMRGELLRLGWALEGQLSIGDGEMLHHGEARALQMLPQLPSHLEIVASRRERVRLVCPKQPLHTGRQGHMAKEVVDLRERNPSPRLQVPSPVRQAGG